MTSVLLAPVVLALVMTPGALASDGPVYLNVLDLVNRGCSSDWTGADLQVHVLVDGDEVWTSGEPTNQDESVVGELVSLGQPPIGTEIGIRITEGETWFFSSWRDTCDASPGGAETFTTTWTGETRTLTARGDEAHAAETTFVLGTHAPARPTLRVDEVGTDHVSLSWTGAPSADQHLLHWGFYGKRIATYGSEDASHRVEDLLDNQEHRFRVLRVQGPWKVASEDVRATTENVAPQAPVVRSIGVDNGTVSVSYDSATTHDVARYELHMGPHADFVIGDASLRAQTSMGHWMSAALQDNDLYLRVRTVDTGALHADSKTHRAENWTSMSCCAPPPYQPPPAPPAQPQPPPEPRPEPSKPQPMPPPGPHTFPPILIGAYDVEGSLWVEWTDPHHSSRARYDVHVGATKDLIIDDRSVRASVTRWSADGHATVADLALDDSDRYVAIAAIDHEGNVSTTGTIRIEVVFPPAEPIGLTAKRIGDDVVVRWSGSNASQLREAHVFAGASPVFARDASTARVLTGGGEDGGGLFLRATLHAADRYVALRLVGPAQLTTDSVVVAVETVPEVAADGSERAGQTGASAETRQGTDVQTQDGTEAGGSAVVEVGDSGLSTVLKASIAAGAIVAFGTAFVAARWPRN